MKVIFATGNEGKMREVRKIMEGTEFECVSMKEEGVGLDIVEDGTTFTENALIKAREVSKATGLPAMADDSGIEIDYFDKKPGIYSARWLGEDTTYDIKNGYILDKMKDVPDEKRNARYVCAIALVFPDGREYTTLETLEGMIAHEPAGDGGFGYDPIFYLPEYGRTDAELTTDEKNAISHRGKALRAMIKLYEDTDNK